MPLAIIVVAQSPLFPLKLHCGPLQDQSRSVVRSPTLNCYLIHITTLPMVVNKFTTEKKRIRIDQLLGIACLWAMRDTLLAMINIFFPKEPEMECMLG